MENWKYKYNRPAEVLDFFVDEQEYIDYNFVWLIFHNFGVLLRVEDLYVYA